MQSLNKIVSAIRKIADSKTEKTMKIVVIGGTGLIGAKLVAILKTEGP